MGDPVTTHRDKASAVRSYYEHYWSDEGYQPAGRLDPLLEEWLVRFVPVGGDYLDVGCGDGQTTGIWLNDRAHTYTGVDISARAVEGASALGLRAIQISNAAVLPFDAESFDAVVCIEVLEHLFAPHDAAAEMLRVLRPGGVLAASVPNVAYWRRRAELALLGRWNPFGDDLSTKQPWRDPHIRFFTGATLARMLETVGFDVRAVRSQGGAWLAEFPPLRKLVRARGGRVYRTLERLAPSLLGGRVYVAAVKPEAGMGRSGSPTSAESAQQRPDEDVSPR